MPSLRSRMIYAVRQDQAANPEPLDRIVAEFDRLHQWIDDLQSGQYVNCVYCGHRYGPKESTPVSHAELLKRHVQECPRHPMSKFKKALELVPPLLKQIRGFANDCFGGPSSLTDCIDLVLIEVETTLAEGRPNDSA